MAFSQDYLEFILEQFSEFGEVSYKKMFGGVGFYKQEIMFGGIMGGTLHFKVDDTTRPNYLTAGMSSFFEHEKNKGKAKYYEVPIDVIEDRTNLALWANQAVEVAKKSKK